MRNLSKFLFGLFFCIVILSASSIVYSQQQRQLHFYEIKLTNNYGSTINVELKNVETSSTSEKDVLNGDYIEMSFDGNTLDLNGTENTLYEITIRNSLEQILYQYTYMLCDTSTLDEDDKGYFCPNYGVIPSPQQADFDIYVDPSDIRIEPPLALNPGTGNSRDLTTYFGDDNWIVPYNLDTFCAGGTSCDPDTVLWFLTPQLSEDTFEFTSASIDQPSSTIWRFNNVDLTFPAEVTVTLNGGIIVENSTISFDDDASLIYNGPSNGFVIAPGTIFYLGDHVRFTFESEIQLAGTSTDTISFLPLTGSDEWDYLDLKADGNDFDYVVLDGGYKTIEVRSDNNTFDNVTSKNGYRGFSSYLSAAGGRSSFSLNNSTVQDHRSVGVVAYNSDFALTNSTIVDNGQAGLWLTTAEATSFTGNTISGNAMTSTTRSGIEVNGSGDLDSGNSAHNVIKNNVYHEIQSSGSGLVSLGVYVNPSDAGGSNDIYDVGTQASGERYIYEGGSYVIYAEGNCWNTTGAPSSSFFFGTVNFGNHETCSGLSKGFAGQNDTSSNRARILAARSVVTGSAPFYQANDIARLYQAQKADRGNSSAEYSRTYEVLRGIATQDATAYGKEAVLARERAILVLIREAISAEDMPRATTLLIELGSVIADTENQIELMFFSASVLEYGAYYHEALEALAQIEAHPGFKGDQSNVLIVMREAINERLNDGSIAKSTDSGLRYAATKLGNDQVGDAQETVANQMSVYPNPFNPTTNVTITLESAADTKLELYNVLGQRVMTVADRRLFAGTHRFQLVSADLPSGTYLLRLQVGNAISTRHVVLMK